MNIDRLKLDLDYPQEEVHQMTNLSSPPPPMTEKEAEGEEETMTTQEKTDIRIDDYQPGEDPEQRQRIYVGQVSDIESNTSSEHLWCSY